MNHHQSPPSKLIQTVASVLAVGIAIWLGIWLTANHDLHASHESHMPAYWYIGIIPFVGILGSIAILPILKSTEAWWECNSNRFFVAMACSAATIAYMVMTSGQDSIGLMLDHAIMKDYIPFIVLLFALYVISGGIHLGGDLVATPATNTLFLAIGALMASFVGTTGASMLLIRPLLKTNSQRKHVVHTVVMFIFLVSNIGGTLLPIGDPPLFLGYLRGVPFLWTLELWPMWATTCGILLVVYFIWDSVLWSKETERSHKKDIRELVPLHIQGWTNFLYIGGIVATAALIDSNKTLVGTNWQPFPYMRELVMLFFVFLSLQTTKKAIRKANNFSYHAIIEVAALFSGIFIGSSVSILVV